MKVLMVTYSFPPRYAGTTVQAIYLSKELMKANVDLAIVTNNFKDKTIIDEYEGIKVYKFCTYFEDSINKLWILRNFIYMLKVLILAIKSKYQIVFFHTIGGYDAWIVPILKLFNKKTILELTLVGGDDPVTLKRRKFGFLIFPFIRMIDRIIPISTRLKDLSIEAGLDEKKIELIPCGVDVNKFKLLETKQREILKRNLGYSDKKYVFIAIGQIEERKGYDFMVKAWKYINFKYPSAMLLIAGSQNDISNKYYQNLLRQIKSENINNIQFLGKIDNVYDYMRISDCLLHCSIREGLGIVLLEAGISTVPIVCRKIDGITSDIILNPNIGRECALDNPKDFAELVFAILNERKNDQIDFDYKILKEKYSIEQVAQKYIKLFNSLISNA